MEQLSAALGDDNTSKMSKVGGQNGWQLAGLGDGGGEGKRIERPYTCLKAASVQCLRIQVSSQGSPKGPTPE